jgi:hypothetical protein
MGVGDRKRGGERNEEKGEKEEGVVQFVYVCGSRG